MTDPIEYISSDTIDDTLEYFFDKYGSDDSILSVVELDGFLAALACAPFALMPSQWLPAMWGGEDQLPEWEEKEEIDDFHEVLMIAHNSVMEEFVAGEFCPRIYAEDGRLVAMDEWCDGFMRGVRLYPRLGEEDQHYLDENLRVIRLFVTGEGVDDLLSLSYEQLQAKAATIEPAVMALRQRFFSRQVIEAHTPYMAAMEKVGRNDPCPCGSGKKFKKCCLH